MTVKIKNSIVLITGANRGIGRGFAEEFIAAGAKKIYLGARNLGTLAEFVASNPKRLIPLQLDVTNPDDIRNAAQKAGDTKILINNAGVLHRGSLLDEDRVEKARQEMEVNYFGPLAMIHAFAPVLKKNGGGVIVNVASIASLVPMPGIPTYSASKAAVHFLTLEMRTELQGEGIHIVGVYPGPVDTDMARSFDLLKVTPDYVAKETIRAIEAGKTSVFPDPLLKDIYAVFHKDADHSLVGGARPVHAVSEPEAHAA